MLWVLGTFLMSFDRSIMIASPFQQCSLSTVLPTRGPSTGTPDLILEDMNWSPRKQLCSKRIWQIPCCKIGLCNSPHWDWALMQFTSLVSRSASAASLRLTCGSSWVYNKAFDLLQTIESKVSLFSAKLCEALTASFQMILGVSCCFFCSSLSPAAVGRSESRSLQKRGRGIFKYRSDAFHVQD